MSTTFATILTMALKAAGVAGGGVTPQPQQSADALQLLNWMLDDWSGRRWMVYHLLDLSHTCDGSLFYTIGPGGQIDTPRVDKLEYAFSRQTVNNVPNQVDYPLYIIESREEYARITLKQLAAGPAYGVFLDSDYPIGKLYAWPLMSSQFELHVGVKAQLTEVTNPQATVNLPGPYQRALYFNLAVDLRAHYRLPESPQLNKRATATLSTIRAANFQIAPLRMPRALLPMSGGGYNILSDSWGPYGS